MTREQTPFHPAASECWLFPYNLNMTVCVHEDGETYLAIHIGDDAFRDSRITREQPLEPPEIDTGWPFWD